MTKYYEMKKQATNEGNGAKRIIAKLFLNSLYGKLLSKINEGDWWKMTKVVSIRLQDDDYNKITKLARVPLGITLRGLIQYFLSLDDELQKEILNNTFLKK